MAKAELAVKEVGRRGWSNCELCEKDGEVKCKTEGMYDWNWQSSTASGLLAPRMGSLCYNAKEWASAKGSNRAFREDSGVSNKSSVIVENSLFSTMENRSTCYSRPCPSHQIQLHSLCGSLSHATADNKIRLHLGWARFAYQYLLCDPQP